MRALSFALSMTAMVMTAGCVSDPSVLAYYPSSAYGNYGSHGAYGNPYIFDDCDDDRPSKKELAQQEKKRRFAEVLRTMREDVEKFQSRNRQIQEERDREQRRKAQQEWEETKKLIDRARSR